MSTLELSVFLAYSSLLLVLSFYGSHRIWMVYLHYRHKYRLPTPAGRFAELPRVTVQLPMFNELFVAERIIDAACALQYPADKLQIQVLDDSTDETQGIARAAVERWRARGVDVVYVHRDQPAGLQGRGAGARARPPPRASSWPSSTPTSSRTADYLAPLHPPLHRPQGRGGAGALGPPEPRPLAPDPGPGHLPRRPLHGGALGPQPLRPLLQLQRHRRHLAHAPPSSTAAAGSTTRSPRTSTSPTGPRSRAGASSSCPTWSPPPSCPRT